MNHRKLHFGREVWVVQNERQLNDDREILLIGSAPGIELSSSVREGQSGIPFFRCRS